MKKLGLALIGILMVIFTFLSLTSCGGDETPSSTPSGSSTVGSANGDNPRDENEPVNLMAGYEKGNIIGLERDGDFASNQWRLAMELFKGVNASGDTSNVLISPLSIQLALAMTANGAKGQTGDEMTAILGGEYTLESLNEYLLDYVENLPTDEKYKLEIANSIWFNKYAITPYDEFLQINKTYYDSEMYAAKFDASTLNAINDWVSEKTNGMVKDILSELKEEDIMCLINAIAFDGEWQEKYTDMSVEEGVFTKEDGTEKTVEMMNSTEHYYIVAGNGVGFKKHYAQNKYSFVALLPNEGVSVDEYIAGLDASELLAAIGNPDTKKRVIASMPKFSYNYEIELSEVLPALGMGTAFDPENADFSSMGITEAPLVLEMVLHKTAISVDTAGTKAGAVTAVMPAPSAPPPGVTIEEVYVTLDRPFVYMIVDETSNTPVFIGTLESVE
ncbi:MAG: serpin family protein [Clostridia bacterium]|nr:serpin family protein [Clostridia bacterium]